MKPCVVGSIRKSRSETRIGGCMEGLSIVVYDTLWCVAELLVIELDVIN